MTQAQPEASADSAVLRYLDVRRRTAQLAAPLCVEDQVVQSMPDASPTKWHLAHTTWFFERFMLHDHARGYQPYNEQYFYLFNSYYNSVGPMHLRPQRGLLSRPTVAEVQTYRAEIDQRMLDWLDYTTLTPEQSFLLSLGLHHEQQHQELILTDIKHALAHNPMLPAYDPSINVQQNAAIPLEFIRVDEGLRHIGTSNPGDHNNFCFDNETPQHKTHMPAHALANRLVTNGEYLEFINDKGYQRPEFWLSEAWGAINQEKWQRPIYWQEDLSSEYSLSGVRVLDANAPVCHLSLYEADAFARWAEARLPTEAELELAASTQSVSGNFYEHGALHPVAPTVLKTPANRSVNQAITHASNEPSSQIHQVFGDVWEWTSSSYSAYPGFKPLAGSLGEYNGKFMCSQHVLRGGSCVSPQSHLRATYRNFFYPQARWQFTGIRLAKDIG